MKVVPRNICISQTWHDAESIIPTGPQMKTSRSVMSGTSSFRCVGESRCAPSRRGVVADHVVDDARRARPRSCRARPRRRRRSARRRGRASTMSPPMFSQQRAHRGDPDPAGDQERLAERAAVVGEDAERPLGEDTRPDRDLAELRAVVAEVLDRDPEGLPVGRLRDRERVLRVPEPLREEPPEEELPGLRPEPVEPAAGDAQRDHPGRLVDHLGDLHVVAERVDHRQEEPVPEHEHERADVEQAPVVRRGDDRRRSSSSRACRRPRARRRPGSGGTTRARSRRRR